MDIEMPIMDGLQTLDYLRSNDVDTPIVMLTGSVLSSVKDRCMAAGCSDFISKPINQSTLYNVLKTYLFSPELENISVHTELLGEDDIQDQLIVKFCLQIGQRLDDVKTRLFENNHTEAQAKLHQLRGALGTYGFDQLSALAHKAEIAIGRGRY
jgi:YesN/AraC family two-component response regulator